MSNEIIAQITESLAVLTVLSHIILIISALMLAYYTLTKQKIAWLEHAFNFIKKESFAFAFIIAAPSAIGSLFLSEIAKLPPCSLCWYQRIFLYPQAIILGIALLKNDSGIKKYIVPLSIFGLIFALYQYWLQMSPVSISCVQDSINCAEKNVFYFNYITIPAMSATSFLLIIALMLFPKIHHTLSMRTNKPSLATKVQSGRKRLTTKSTDRAFKSSRVVRAKRRSRKV